MKTTLLVFSLNEINGLKAIMPKIAKKWCDQIIIVDGGSTDGSKEWAEENGYEVYVQKKKGLRYAYSEVWEYIKGDIVITFSPDGNSIPELIPNLIQKMENNYDMVIVSRYLDGAISYDDDIITKFGNWFFTKTVNFLHGGNYSDVMVMYRAYRKNLAYELDMNKEDPYLLPEKLFFTTIGWEPLLSVRALKKNMKIGEIPGDEPERIGGERKLQIIRWGAAYYFQFIRELWYWR
jgi:glycosyltransferase involved in cell wall biosynthesis